MDYFDSEWKPSNTERMFYNDNTLTAIILFQISLSPISYPEMQSLLLQLLFTVKRIISAVPMITLKGPRKIWLTTSINILYLSMKER